MVIFLLKFLGKEKSFSYYYSFVKMVIFLL